MDRAHPVSESELEILRILWKEAEPVQLGPLLAKLSKQGKQWKPNTVLTFLSRLCDKGMVRIQKQGRLNTYQALFSEEEYLASLAGSFVDSVYGGDAKGLVATLLKQSHLSRADLVELTAYWEEANRNA